MIEISRIDHIGQVVPNLARQVAFLEGLFGFRWQRGWENPGQRCRGALLEVPGRSGVRWEVLEPVGADSPLAPYVERPRGPGLQHVAMQVPDAGAAMQEMRRLGIEPTRDHGSSIETVIDPQGQQDGLLFRFFGSDTSAGCGEDDRASAIDDVSAEQGGRPSLGIVAIDHICHAYRDRDELARWYERVLGMREVYRTPDGEHPDLADLVLDVPGAQMRWEIIQPVGDDSFIQRFLDTRGPAAHHVTFQVEDWERAMAACRAHEVPTFDENQGETDGARWRDAFIHPRSTGGMLVQVFWEEKPDVWVRSDKIASGR